MFELSVLSICKEDLVRALKSDQYDLPLFHMIYRFKIFGVQSHTFISIRDLLDERTSAIYVHVEAVNHVILHTHLQSILYLQVTRYLVYFAEIGVYEDAFPE
jgi:hypothetical protein